MRGSWLVVGAVAVGAVMTYLVKEL